MPTTYTSLLGLALPATGELAGTWGATVNDSITSLLDTAVAGTTTLNTDADVTLSTTTGAANQARQAIILWTANGTVTRNITAPAASKSYVVINATAGTQSIVVRGAGPTVGVTLVSGERAVVAWNGSDFVKIGSNFAAGGSNTQVQFNNSGALAGSANLTFNGTTLTAAGLAGPLNGTVGATTPNTGAFTTLSASNTVTFNPANANLSFAPTGTGTVTINPATAGTINNMAIGGSTAAAGTFTSATVSTGNLTFSGTAQRITGDFSNATVANRLMFQTSTTNGASVVGVIPNGTGTITQFVAYGGSDPTNAQAFRFDNRGGTESRIESTYAGTPASGTYLPMTFYTGGSERVRIDTSGNVGIGTASPGARLDVNGAVILRNGGGGEGGQLELYNPDNAAIGLVVDVSSADTGRIFSTRNNSILQIGQLVGTGGIITLNTAGSERMRIDSSGNVAVGTTNAGTAGLSLNQNYNLSWEQSATESVSNLFRQTSSAALVMSVGYKRSATANGFASSFGSSLAKTAISLGTTAGAITFYTDTAATTAVGTDVTPTERMRIDSSGNVGIGTASPQVRLHAVAADGVTNARFAGASYALRVQSIAATGTVVDATNNTEATYQPLLIGGSQVQFTIVGTERMRIDSSGNVGIGTASPGTKLDVSGTVNASNYQIAGSSATQAGTFGFLNSNGPAIEVWGSSSANAGSMVLKTAGSERMRIDSSGNVGIGTSSPSKKLDVFNSGTTATDLTVRNGTVGLVLFVDAGAGYTGTSTNHPQLFITNNTERMRITATGNVGIGTASPSGPLQVSGAAYFGSNSSQTTGTCAIYNDGNNVTIEAFAGNNTATKRDLLLATYGGNVGIGTASPGALFDVGGGGLRVASTGAMTSGNLTDATGYKGTPLNEQSTAYTLVIGDMGKSIVHPSTDNNARTFTIPANGTVAFPVGTTITFINMINTVTIAITTDTMYLAGAGTTGSRTLAAYGMATAVKMTSTSWIISGNGLT